MKRNSSDSNSEQEEESTQTRSKNEIMRHQLKQSSISFEQAFPSSSEYYLTNQYKSKAEGQHNSKQFDELFEQNREKKQIDQPTDVTTANYDQQFSTISFNRGGHGDNLLELDHQDKFEDDPLKSKPKYFQFLKNRFLEIEGPQLINQGVMTSYKLYRIKSKKLQPETSKINSQTQHSGQWQTCVARRFSDFQYLQTQLISNYGGHIIPLLPQKNLWASINLQGQNFIEMRKKSLLKYINRLLMHQILRTSDQVRIFLFVDDGKFSSAKGQHFSHVKAEDKIRSLASNAYSYGLDFISRFTQNKKPVTIINPTQEDLELTRYQLLVNELARVIGYLRNMVENTAKQMQLISRIRRSLNNSGDQKQQKKIDKQSARLLQQFEDLCKFIQSCSDALLRRKQVRLALDQLHQQQDKIAKKIKSNPRAQQIDMLRNRIEKTSQQCHRWTKTLIYQLSKNVYLGRSMLESFIKSYQQFKNLCYTTNQTE